MSPVRCHPPAAWESVAVALRAEGGGPFKAGGWRGSAALARQRRHGGNEPRVGSPGTPRHPRIHPRIPARDPPFPRDPRPRPHRGRSVPSRPPGVSPGPPPSSRSATQEPRPQERNLPAAGGLCFFIHFIIFSINFNSHFYSSFLTPPRPARGARDGGPGAAPALCPRGPLPVVGVPRGQGQGTMGLEPAGLPGLLTLAGALPAGTPLLLDVGHTLPPGGDALSHGRGLDVSLGAAVGFGGHAGRGLGAAGVVGSRPVPSPLSLPGSHQDFLRCWFSPPKPSLLARPAPSHGPGWVWAVWGQGWAGDKGCHICRPRHSPRSTHV